MGGDSPSHRSPPYFLAMFPLMPPSSRYTSLRLVGHTLEFADYPRQTPDLHPFQSRVLPRPWARNRCQVVGPLPRSPHYAGGAALGSAGLSCSLSWTAGTPFRAWVLLLTETVNVVLPPATSLPPLPLLPPSPSLPSLPALFPLPSLPPLPLLPPSIAFTCWLDTRGSSPVLHTATIRTLCAEFGQCLLCSALPCPAPPCPSPELS